MATEKLDRCGVHMMSSLVTLHSALEKKVLPDNVPVALLKLVWKGYNEKAHGAWKRKRERESDEAVSRLQLDEKAGSMTMKEVMEPLLHVRKLACARPSAISDPTLRVCVGDFALLMTPPSVPYNYVLYVSEVYSDGVTDAISGFYVYTKDDVKAIIGCTEYSGDDNEVFLTHHFVEVSLCNVVGVATVLPKFCRRGEDDLYYSRFFDHTTGKMYKLDFGLPKPKASLEFLWLNHQSRVGQFGWGLLKTLVLSAMENYCCTWRERPGGPRRGGGIRMKLPYLCLDYVMALPLKVIETMRYEGGGRWDLQLKKKDVFEEIFGEGTLERRVKARKAGGQELLTYTFFLKMRLSLSTRDGDGMSYCTFAGVKLQNGAGVQQWNTLDSKGS